MLDDELYVTANRQVQKGLTRESVAWAFTATHAANWHPLTWLSHMLDVELFGLRPGPHHLHSLLLHILNTLLLFLLLRRLTGALWRSALVAALFALHPLHVESVAWIAERKDVLSTLFWLLALAAWAAYARAPKVGPYGLALALFALGLMAKPMLVTLPFTLLLLDFWPLGRWPRPFRWETATGLLREKLPFFALSAASAVITWTAQAKAGSVAGLAQIPLLERFLNACRAYLAYLGKTVWPTALSVFYPHPRAGALTAAAVFSGLILVGITACAFALRRRAPYAWFGWLWYLGTLVPVIGLVQVGKQAMADRYTYVPLIGIFIAMAWGLAEIARGNRVRRAWIAAAAVAALGLLSAATRIQVRTWADNDALFTHALAVAPQSDLIRFQVGNTRLLQGRLDEAITHLEEAVRLNPREAESRNSLALALLRTGRIAEGLEHLRQAYRLQPNNQDAAHNLAMTLLKTAMDLTARRDYRSALPLYEEASTLMAPLPPEGNSQWGIALLGLNRYAEAAGRFQQVLAERPESGEAHFQLGFALSQLQRHEEAIAHYRQAYGKPGVQSASFIWVGDIYRQGGLCREAVLVYRMLAPDDPEYPKAAAGIAACSIAR
jgi:Flp pilus assembly protein TadD